jgi:hypothetical protein
MQGGGSKRFDKEKEGEEGGAISRRHRAFSGLVLRVLLTIVLFGWARYCKQHRQFVFSYHTTSIYYFANCIFKSQV